MSLCGQRCATDSGTSNQSGMAFLSALRMYRLLCVKVLSLM